MASKVDVGGLKKAEKKGINQSYHYYYHDDNHLFLRFVLI